jgi:Xaa-Pro dipeptidase
VKGGKKMKREEDVNKKIESVRKYMFEHHAKGAVIKGIENFSWITSGGRSYIALSDTEGSAAVFITKDEAYVVTNNIEAKRMKNEELPSNFTIVEYPWYTKLEDMITKISDGSEILYEDESNFKNFLFHSRLRLSPYEQERYKIVGVKSAKALERAVKSFSPDMTEVEAKAKVEAELSKEGLDILLILVFSDESRTLYRHNLPREVKLGNKCIASICAKMFGLVISATRTIEFERDKDFEAQHKLNALVDAEIINSSFEKSLISQIFFDIEKIYESHGYPQEWQLHHQGGVTGYRTREFVAIPHFPFQLEDGMALAWNPTITGTKSEDTYIRTSQGMELISVNDDGTWPYLEFEVNGKKYKRPDVLKI